MIRLPSRISTKAPEARADDGEDRIADRLVAPACLERAALGLEWRRLAASGRLRIVARDLPRFPRRPGPRPSPLPAAGCTAAARRCRRRARSPSRRTSSPRHSGSGPSDRSAAARTSPTRSASSSSPGWSFRSMAKFCTLTSRRWRRRPCSSPSSARRTCRPCCATASWSGGSARHRRFRRSRCRPDVVHRAGDAVAALGAGCRPATCTLVDDTDLGLPVGALHRQVVGEHERRAGAVGAINRGDRRLGSFTPGLSAAIFGSFHLVILPR